VPEDTIEEKFPESALSEALSHNTKTTMSSCTDDNNNQDSFRGFTDHDIDQIRQRAAMILSSLDEEYQPFRDDTNNATTATTTHHSWLNGDVSPSSEAAQITERCRYFDEYGFVLVPNFSNDSEIAAMKQQMADLTRTSWDPSKKTISFRTDEESNTKQGSDDYFLESASRVHFFAEPQSLDAENGSLKPQYCVENNKLAALNKAGHGMHMIPGAFQDYATSKKVKNLVQELGWRDPVVPQSMYIFKQPRIGEPVNSHQDSTFLFTTPRQSCLGLWLALDDATVENGCLWVRPRSHKESLRRQFKRNPKYFGQAAIDSGSNVAEGDLTEPKMIMETLNDDQNVPWEGELPRDWDKDSCKGLFDAGFVPIECKAGDLLAFPGEVDHLSLPNVSESPRHTFQLHLVEGESAGVTWSRTNWLQYPAGTRFLSIKK
jgi:phytanoyl-CoA hydroxylase